MVSVSSRLKQLRYRWSPQGFVAELMGKSWFEPALPLALLIAAIIAFTVVVPTFSDPFQMRIMVRELPEFALVVLGIGLTLIAGGIDLSVGAILGITNFVMLMSLVMWGVPAWLGILVTLAVGVLIGAFNGFVVAYLKGRPFLTTLVTLIILQGVLSIITVNYSAQLAQAPPSSMLWDFLGSGTVAGIPADFVMLLAVFLIGHIFLSRSRPGRHLTAVGSSRRAARHAGIKVERTLLMTYALSGLLCGAAGVLTAARLQSASAQIGQNLVYSVLAAAVIGGISLAGGRGTVWRALIGGGLIFVLSNGLGQLGVAGNMYGLIIGVVLVVAVGGDIKWAKNRGKVASKIYINPTLVEYGELADTSADAGTPFAANDRLRLAQPIGVGKVEGPEDVIVDSQGRVYSGDRRGWIMRFSGENFSQREVFAQPGGMPLGLAFDRAENLVVCVGGMGLYSVTPDGTVRKLTDETNRSWWKLRDDSRLRLPDDLDITPDGKIYFSEATERFEAPDWILDGLEGRPNGRLVCFDPATDKTRTAVRNLVFPNGVCSCHDGQSLLIAQTWLCRILRYWHSGPKKGKIEVFVDNLPGYLDNINRASDGSYWVALNGMRSPAFDLAYRMPSFRRRMLKRIPRDEWLYPNMNYGFVMKIDDDANVLESLWDPGGERHSTITSMRECDGYLYIGGLENNRIGRIKLPERARTCTCGQPPCASEHDGRRPANAMTSIGGAGARTAG